MCGIAGAVSTGFVDRLISRRMCRVIEHRGPNGVGLHDEPHATLGMRRLAIIDIAGGDQPVYNEDGSVVAVFNGEVYNFATLQADLRRRRHRFTTNGNRSASSISTRSTGADLALHLRGMFAFAIWDSRRSRRLLGRDRLGKKPLYYRVDGDALWPPDMCSPGSSALSPRSGNVP
jgi:asparagine synthase (glutamine-hydrolysing)